MVTIIELIGCLRPAEHMQMVYYFSASIWLSLIYLLGLAQLMFSVVIIFVLIWSSIHQRTEAQEVQKCQKFVLIIKASVQI